MKLFESFAMAVRSLFANKLRSSLTMLGIIIGVGAVISLMSVGRGAQEMITATFEDLGSNLLTVMPSTSDAEGAIAMSYAYMSPSLTLDDARALERIPAVIAVDTTNENMLEMTFAGESMIAVVHGASPRYQKIYNFTIAQGQFLSDRNVASRDQVVVLGAGVAEELFATANPVGEKVKIKGLRFTVIGTFQPKGGAMFGVSLDDVAVIPITVFQTRLFTQRTPSGEDAVHSIVVQVATPEDMDRVSGEIKNVLRRRHRIDAGEKDDFAIVSMEQMLGMVQQVTAIFTVVLGAIASISLIVGSIGIMNIMLVSVTERTREIGIRKAIGAKRRDILLQFLVEAALLSLVGGAIGITLGWLLSVAISQVDLEGTRLTAVVTLDTVILAVSVSVFIGLASGMYPAVRAARLNPIDALHYG